MPIVNLTPHVLTLRPAFGQDLKIYPDDIVARVSTAPGSKLCDLALGADPGDERTIAIYRASTLGAVEGLPAAKVETVYLVSAVVAAALVGQGRVDVFVPGTGPQDGAVRFREGPHQGQIEAVTRLVQAPQ